MREREIYIYIKREKEKEKERERIIFSRFEMFANANPSRETLD